MALRTAFYLPPGLVQGQRNVSVYKTCADVVGQCWCRFSWLLLLLFKEAGKADLLHPGLVIQMGRLRPLCNGKLAGW